VIVPHYNQKDLLVKCLHSLQAQQQAPDYEVIVADNATPGGIDDIIVMFPDVRFVTATERGAAPARNAALEVASGEIIAFTDSDCVADPYWLKHGVEALEQDIGDIIGGDIHVTYADQDTPSAVELFEQVFAFRQKLYVNKRHFSVTANLITRAEVVAKTGLFINGLPEDVDWCHRAVALGFRLSFYRKQLVSHPARQSWRALENKWHRLISERWAEQVAARKGLSIALVRWCLVAAATALSALPHSLNVLCTTKLSGWSQRFAALCILWRIRFWRCRKMVAKAVSAIKGGDADLEKSVASNGSSSTPRRV
jgi:GT2 family glycosyltransferase